MIDVRKSFFVKYVPNAQLHAVLSLEPTDDERLARRASWTRALRSGKYQQGFGVLREVVATGDLHYCCLGVLEDVRGCRWELTAKAECQMFTAPSASPHGCSERILTPETARWLGLWSTEPYAYVPSNDKIAQLTELNDHDGFTLGEIADVIDAQPLNWDGTQSQVKRYWRETLWNATTTTTTSTAEQ